MSTSKKQNGTITGETKGQVTKKSGKGNNHGFISEVSSVLHRQAGSRGGGARGCRRFGEMLRNSDPKDVQKTGLRDARLVVFDDGRRLMFASGFETDWDPYVDDAILIVGIEHFLDWLQHTVEAEELVASVKSLVKDIDKNDPAFEEKAKPAGAKLKAVIQKDSDPGDRLLQRTERSYDSADQEGPAPPAGLPAGARRPGRREGTPTPGPEAAARAGGRLTWAIHRW